jgi:xanthine/uracil permease
MAGKLELIIRRPNNLIYWLDERPPLPILAVIGLQHVAVLSIPLLYAVVVATGGGASLDQEINLVSLGMIGSASGGLLQNKRRGPVGSGFLVIPGLPACIWPDRWSRCGSVECPWSGD